MRVDRAAYQGYLFVLTGNIRPYRSAFKGSAYFYDQLVDKDRPWQKNHCKAEDAAKDQPVRRQA